MENIKVSIYTKSDLPAFQEYIRQIARPKYIMADPAYLDWQFNQSLFIARSGDKIVGHFGCLDLPYKIYDKTQPVRLIMNLFVMEEYRGTGVGKALGEKVLGTDDPAVVSGYSDSGHRLFIRFRKNWKTVGNLDRYLAILNEKHPLFANYKISQRAAIKSELPAGWEVEAVASFFPELADFWQKVRSQYPVTVERTKEYLLWRFFNHPFFRYSVLAAKQNGVLKGYLIFRFEEDQNFKIARIVDWISEPEAEAPILQKFLEVASAAGANMADFVFSGNQYRKTLLASGFFQDAGTDFEKFPICFNPISSKKPYVNIGFDLPVDFADCFFTKADADQDRPNPH
ncbi:MAG: hypothetical protein G01um10143_143 [Parcubacteria group bacterium Gr01-1014_3]|nr:MAG: hypothetical protein G01um10143_143 [Parcubacteria group bacterium Gr01-1014_3]